MDSLNRLGPRRLSRLIVLCSVAFSTAAFGQQIEDEWGMDVRGFARGTYSVRTIGQLPQGPAGRAVLPGQGGLGLARTGSFLTVGTEGGPALEPGERRHEVPPHKTNQPFHLDLVGTLAGAAIAVLEKVMGLKPAERPRPLPGAVRKDARHQALVVVVEDRSGNPAEEGEGRIVAVQPSLRRRRRVGHGEAGIAVGKVHGEKMRPPLDAGDDRIRLAKVRLGMARRMRQRYEHLPETTAPFPNVILDDGLPTREAMLVAKTLEDPLRRVALLAVNRSVLFQNTVNDSREGVQLRALRSLAAAVARRLRLPEHLLYRLSRHAKPTRRLSLAQSINMTCQPNA